MTDLLEATETSSRAGLVKALERAAAGGRTSTAETLLGALAERFPASADAEAARALTRAVHSHRWTTAAYLADFLADTAPPTVSIQVSGGGAPGEHIDQEVLRCLADHRQDDLGDFVLTDEIEETCLERGIGFAISVAIVDCASKGVPPADRPACARGAVAASAHGGGKEPAGARGRAITFEHVYPGLPAGVYGGADRPCRHFCLAEPDRSAALLQGGSDPVVPAGPLRLQLDFPPDIAGTYLVTSPGTREGLARAVAETCRKLMADGQSQYDLSELDLERVVRADGPGGGAPTYSAVVV
jgi:hypothetical protein